MQQFGSLEATAAAVELEHDGVVGADHDALPRHLEPLCDNLAARCPISATEMGIKERKQLQMSSSGLGHCRGMGTHSPIVQGKGRFLEGDTSLCKDGRQEADGVGWALRMGGSCRLVSALSVHSSL